ncbi:MAG: hypothetical protein QUU85_17335, partial [Candidatus Eisenbacteria bacterium]|nr:hypothetical protein [Candidatus Eisenbacteria bacterium]
MNHGTVDADDSDGILSLTGYSKSNSGLFRASNGGLLHLLSFSLDNSGGTILADGGDVLLEGTSMNVSGGTIGSSGSSMIRSKNACLTGVTIPPGRWIDVPHNYSLYLYGDRVVNDGTIRVNDARTADATLDVRANLSLAGDGEILLNGDNEGDAILAYYGHVLTQEAGHTIRGSGGITAPLRNHGTVDADRGAGGFLRISGAEKQNDGLLRASGGGELQIYSCTIQNGSGTIFADGGNVDLYNQSNLVGGTLRSSGSSLLRARNGWFTGVSISAESRVEIPHGYT